LNFLASEANVDKLTLISCYLNNWKLFPEQFYSPNNKILLSACTFNRPVSAYFAKDAIGSSTREDEDFRGSIDDAYRHYSWGRQAQLLGYDEVEALNQTKVARKLIIVQESSK